MPPNLIQEELQWRRSMMDGEERLLELNEFSESDGHSATEQPKSFRQLPWPFFLVYRKALRNRLANSWNWIWIACLGTTE